MKETYGTVEEFPSPKQDPRPSPLWTQQQNTAASLFQPTTTSSDPPPGIDALAYAAGERAAWSRAFQAALPGQQALGQLFTAVDVLHTRLETDAAAVRALQLDQARALTSLENAVRRLDVVEHSQLPALQQKWEEYATRPPISPEVIEALQQLRTVLSNMSQQQEQLYQASSLSNFPVNQLRWLLATAAGLSSNALSKADVAAVFLSRKVLISDVMHPNKRTQIILGAATFTLAVEAAWQLHERLHWSLKLPTVGPIRTGLKATRVAVWSAVFILGLDGVRTACVDTSDKVVSFWQGAFGQKNGGGLNNKDGGGVEGGNKGDNKANGADSSTGHGTQQNVVQNALYDDSV